VRLGDGYYTTWERETRSDYLAGDEFGAEQMLQATDVAGMDLAVACPLRQAIDSAYVRSAQQRWPDRVIDFGQVNPRLDGAADEVGQCVRNGLRGIKLHPTMRGYCFCDYRLLFPAVPVLIAHKGTVWNVIEAIQVAERTPNLYLETSWAHVLDVRFPAARPGEDHHGHRLARLRFPPRTHEDRPNDPDPEHRQRVEGGNLAALPGLEPGRMTSADRRDLA
jgi:hypothetical protein